MIVPMHPVDGFQAVGTLLQLPALPQAQPAALCLIAKKITMTQNGAILISLMTMWYDFTHRYFPYQCIALCGALSKVEGNFSATASDKSHGFLPYGVGWYRHTFETPSGYAPSVR
jgi:hypothetical protein